jgi:uncharacterized protein (TIGR02646 family)
MIHVQRTYPPPATLTSTKAQESRDELERLVQAGEVKLSFDSGLYGAKDVKAALQDMQHDKCCFCESQITHIAYGDVEHFRPKGAVQEDDGQLTQPGYYWLAYTWENLLFACQICNQREKRNKFPVEGVRAKWPTDALDHESPLFIDPTGLDDPEALITFTDKGQAVAVDGDRRGGVTIEALGLNRDDLVERRRKQWQYLLLLVTVKQLAEAMQDHDRLEFAEQRLACCISPDAEYAGLARAFLKRCVV